MFRWLTTAFPKKGKRTDPASEAAVEAASLDLGAPLPQDIEAARVEIARRIEAGEPIPLYMVPDREGN